MIDTYWRDQAHETQEQVWAACRALGALEAVLDMFDGVGDYAPEDRIGDGAWLAERVREQVAALESALIPAKVGQP